MPVLCYVEGFWAFFTTRPLAEQWGDDWDDAPYEHNAGRPYGPCWHNEPAHRNDPKALRGWKPGTQTPLEVGELCRCHTCAQEWNDDGTPAYEVTKLGWFGPFEAPCSGVANSNWSVEQINAGATAWLRTRGISPPVAIHAGATIEEFTAKITSAGGTVVLPESRSPHAFSGEGNAVLIAAAPELAEALRELHDFAVTDPYYRYGERSLNAFVRAAELLKRVGF
jgi:hypothetical protein